MNAYIFGAATALALTLAAGSAQASVGTPMVATKAAGTDAAPKAVEKRYCIVDTFTGSRIARKKCQTRKEWLDRGFDPLAPKN